MFVVAVFFLLLQQQSAQAAETFFVAAVFDRSPTCDAATLVSVESTPQSACLWDGQSARFWNCTSGDPIAYDCGTDRTCSGACVPGPLPLRFNSSQCALYLPGSTQYARRWCSATELPFVGHGLRVRLSRRWHTKEGCAAKSPAAYRSVVGLALRCANASATVSAGDTCAIAANGAVSFATQVCSASPTCAAGCTSLAQPTPPACSLDATSPTTYGIAGCWIDGAEALVDGTTAGSSAAATTATGTTASTSAGGSVASTAGGSVAPTTAGSAGSGPSTGGSSTTAAAADSTNGAAGVVLAVAVAALAFLIQI